jgi:catechol 2,3-dioxygenase-like lactoylglutathione lyase family enzyme
MGIGISVKLESFDHVALWVSQRDVLAALLVGVCGMHVIHEAPDFTLVGGDARCGKLTLFDSEGRRDRGVLERVVIRVPDLEEVYARVESWNGVANRGESAALALDAPSNLRLGIVQGASESVDLDHVVLQVPDPGATALALASLGLEPDGDRLRVGNRYLALRRGELESGPNPLLNHLAFLVDSADAAADEARERGLEIDRVVDAANTRAVFFWGPDRIRIELVEHKPSFSLV